MYCFFAKRALRVSASLILCLLLSTSTLAALEQPTRNDAEQITLNMRDADIVAVIQWIADLTNKQIILDPRVRGKITVLANKPMSVDAAYQVFLSALNVYGYAAIEQDGILRIIPASHAKTSPSSILDNFDQLGGGEQAVYVFRPEQLPANELVKVLKPLISNRGYISSLKQGNQIVIADAGSNIKRIAALIDRIDSRGQLDLKVIKLQHASAKTVADVVISLLTSDNNLDFTIASDERSNSVLMSGDTATQLRVGKLISQLDQPISKSATTKVIYLHYVDAKELLPILNDMAKPSPGEDLLTRAVSVNASESANALIISAPAPMLTAMEDVIALIDIRRAQVLVEAVIVEVSEGFSQTLGVEWNTSLSASQGLEAITNFGLKTVDPDSGDAKLLGRGLSLGFYNKGSLRAIIRALANEDDVNILSTPSLLTLDNEEAEILVGSNVPFLTGQSTGEASNTNNPFNTIERHDIGLTLRITPKINEGDAITLDIVQEMETINESLDIAQDIITKKRSIKTKVLVQDEAILVLGGLISDERSELVSKVPLLGDMPLIGGLFRTTKTEISKKNLMVFIHPVIIDSDEVSNNISEQKYRLMKNLREKYSSGKFNQHQSDIIDDPYQDLTNKTEH